MQSEMSADMLVELLEAFDRAGIELWLDGGWAVDGVLGEQTRSHKDVDVIVRRDDLATLHEVLGARGYARREGGTESNFVLADQHGHEIDIHAIDFDPEGNGVYRMENGSDWIFPAAGFTGRGVVRGVAVRCLTPEVQVLCHAHGYVPTEKDVRDMERLHSRFGVELPSPLQRHGHRAPTTITTKRLVLRQPRLSDAEAVFGYARDPEVTRYMDWPTHTSVADAVAFLEHAVSRWESGEEYVWMITKPEDRAIGGVACRVRGHAVDLGYVLDRSHWNQGYATEAAQAVLDWAANLEGVHRVWATCDVENAASARVLEKIGMSREGILRRWAIRPNLTDSSPRDAFVYSWVRTTVRRAPSDLARPSSTVRAPSEERAGRHIKPVGYQPKP